MLPLRPAIVEEQFIDHCDIMDKAGCFDERMAARSPTVAENGDGCVMVENEKGDMKCDDKCKIFGWLSESTTVVEETEVHQSCQQYPDLSQVVSAAHSAVGADDVLWRLEASRKGRDSTLPSTEVLDDDRIGGGTWLDQPAPAAVIAPQPIFSEESSVKDKYQEFEDTQHGNKENCESFVLPNCGAEFEKNKEGLEEPRSEVRSNVGCDVRSGAEDKENYEEFDDEENYEEFEGGESCEEFESEDEENCEEIEDKMQLLKLLSHLFDTAGANDIGEDCEESETGDEDYEESKLLNNGTMNATWLSRPVGVEAWLDRPANNYEQSELLNIGVKLDSKESRSEDVGDVADIKGAKDGRGVTDVREDCMKNISSNVRLCESMLCAQNLREQEGTGNRTVIITEKMKEVEMCENCENCLDRESPHWAKLLSWTEEAPCRRQVKLLP